MSSPDMESAAPSLRDHIESAVAQHSPGPDVDSIVNSAVQQRDREIRTRDRATPLDRYQLEADRQDRRHSATRNAVQEVTLKTVRGENSAPKPSAEAPVGPPQSWDSKAKAAWHELPQEVRLATQRDHSQFKTGYDNHVMPHLQRLGELEQVLAPHRERYQQHGLRSDTEYVNRLTGWDSAIANPQTRVQAVAEIMVQTGVTVHDLFALAGAPQAYQQYAQHYGGDAQQPNYSPQQEQAMQQQLARFSQDKPHFEQVRVAMGLLMHVHGEQYLMADGNPDLDKAYRDACRNLGLSQSARASSPPSRSVRHDTRQHSGGSVRRDLVDAWNQHRG